MQRLQPFLLLCMILGACDDSGGGDLDSSVPNDGAAPDGGRPALCLLEPEPGPCDALFHRYYFDPATQRCQHFVYGGCQGNANDFASLQDCRSDCLEPADPPTACEVEGVVYPSGSRDIGDPVSCNTCQCDAGQLTACTEIACPESCPEGTTFATDCSQCGPADGCEVMRTGCLPSCDEDEPCSEGGSCIEGVCRMLCG